MPAQRTIPNDFFKYRTAPYGGSGSSGKPSTNGSGITFNPKSEPLEAPGPYPLPNKELARSDPLHHYIIRTGHFKGKTFIQVNAENPTYLSWIRKKYYAELDDDHILRKILDQWAPTAATTNTLPRLSSAPEKFRHDGYHIYMQQRCLKKASKITLEELLDAGAEPKDSNNPMTAAKQFALFHVYEYATSKEKLSIQEAECAADLEIERVKGMRSNYSRYKSGGYGDMYSDDFKYSYS
jgi:hypothetical protein